MIVTPEDVADFIHDKLSQQAETVGIAYVGYGDTVLIPDYPACLVVPGRKAKVLHATQTFNVELECDLFVLHAVLTKDRGQRTKKDLQLVTEVEGILESDYEFKDVNGVAQIIFGYVQEAVPGVANRARGQAVLSTRMTWVGLSQRRF
jgi:hypothetical protein